MNVALVHGKVGKDATMKEFADGGAVVNFSVATNKDYVDKAGEKKQATEWHNIVAWGQTGKACAQLKKGNEVFVVGEIKTRKYEKDGQTRYVTEVIAQRVFLALQGPQAGQKPATPPPSAPPQEPGEPDLPF